MSGLVDDTTAAPAPAPFTLSQERGVVENSIPLESAHTEPAQSNGIAKLRSFLRVFREMMNRNVVDTMKLWTTELLRVCNASPRAEALLATPLLLASLASTVIFLFLTSIMLVIVFVGAVARSFWFFFVTSWEAVWIVAGVLDWLWTFFKIAILVWIVAIAVFLAGNIVLSSLAPPIRLAKERNILPQSISKEIDWIQARNRFFAVVDACNETMLHVFSSVPPDTTNVAHRNRGLDEHLSPSISQGEASSLKHQENGEQEFVVIRDDDGKNLEMPSLASAEGLRHRG
ncbi:hypothetical protein CPB83DRAFT_862300 [Crepidotus variabilis]|uniref:Uncharacterized protein n=1 Tax=Crepidotus variabilis TaxID=179855 RepID=A0A9P6E7B0_9AGAR|nr:hypothetical protein CPB83DRAFT_862300 [Crepidotus variabilis]